MSFGTWSKVWPKISKVFVGRPSLCIYRMIQKFVSHGIDPWFYVVYGISPWFFTHSNFRGFCHFLRWWGFVAINSHLPYIYEGRNNDYLDQFGGNLIVKVKNGGNNDGIMMYNYGVDHRELCGQIFVLTKSLIFCSVISAH